MKLLLLPVTQLQGCEAHLVLAGLLVGEPAKHAGLLEGEVRRQAAGVAGDGERSLVRDHQVAACQAADVGAPLHVSMACFKNPFNKV